MLVIPAGIRAWSDGQESLQLYLQEDDFWSESDKWSSGLGVSEYCCFREEPMNLYLETYFAISPTQWLAEVPCWPEGRSCSAIMVSALDLWSDVLRNSPKLSQSCEA